MHPATRHSPLVAVTLCLPLAGCSDSAGPAGGRSTPTATPTTTPGAAADPSTASMRAAFNL
jgi:hypothetical protein